MAMSYVIRKTSPTVVPLALRAISISSARVVLPESGSFRSHQFSTAAVDKKLVKVLKSEIKSMERTSLFECTKSQVPAIPPAGFPFKIKDDYSTIKLIRELPGEEIEVCVWEPTVIRKKFDTDMSSLTDDESNTDNDNNSSTNSSDDEEEEKSCNANPSLVVVPLKVKIFKKDGTFMAIEVLGCAHVIIVESININVPCDEALQHDINMACDAVIQHDGRCYEMNSAPDFKELARDLQYSIKEFLGVRGINKTNAEFLIKVSNDFFTYKREMHFLEAFKNFVPRQVC